MKYQVLFEKQIELSSGNLKKQSNLFQFFIKNQHFENRSSSFKDKINEKLRLFCLNLYTKWNNVSRCHQRFRKNNQKWLQRDFIVDDSIVETKAVGRPYKEFNQLSNRSKRRRTQNMRAANSIDALAHASSSKFRSLQQSDASNIINQITSPEEAKKLSKLIKTSQPFTISKEDALETIINDRLSKNQYYSLVKKNKQSNNMTFPPYYQVQQAKTECYLPDSKMTVTINYSEVEVQGLVDLTLSRLIETLEAENFVNGDHLTARFKWGCDGFSGLNETKQKMSTETDENYDEKKIFMSTLVLLDLVSTETNKMIWVNPKPSSVHYTRPIMFEHLKETPETTVRHVQHVQNQIDNLQKTIVKLSAKNLTSNTRSFLL
jgi:hypothetical protein